MLRTFNQIKNKIQDLPSVCTPDELDQTLCDNTHDQLQCHRSVHYNLDLFVTSNSNLGLKHQKAISLKVVVCIEAGTYINSHHIYMTTINQEEGQREKKELTRERNDAAQLIGEKRSQSLHCYDYNEQLKLISPFATIPKLCKLV